MKFFRFNYWFYIFILILSAVIGMVAPLLFRELIDQQQFAFNNKLFLLLIGVYLLQYVINIIGSYFIKKYSEEEIEGLRNQLLQRLFNAKIETFDHINTGEYVSMLNNHVTIVRDYIGSSLPQFVMNIVTILGTLIILILLDWKLTLFIFVALPLMVVLVQPLSQLSSKYTTAYLSQLDVFSSHLMDDLGAIRHIKAYNMEDDTTTKLSHQVRSLKENAIKTGIVDIMTTPLALMIIFGAMSFVFAVGGQRVATGSLTIGTLISFLIYLLNLLNPFGGLTSYFTQKAKFKTALGTMEQTLELPQESVGMNEIETVQTIEFDHVSFSYPEAEQKAINDVNLHINRGEKVAIVGPSGSGKSTIASLLLKLYEDYSGEINVNGQALADIKRVDWRDQVAYVSQSDGIISGTVRENILFGQNKAITDEEMIEMFDKFDFNVQADNPASILDMQVGEQGKLLSGGQKQKIQIMRAYLKQSLLVILDEATSNLDAESESEVMTYLDDLIHENSALIIAHRLSTVVHSDRIYFIEDGVITGSGHHKALMETHERYKDFVTKQMI